MPRKIGPSSPRVKNSASATGLEALVPLSVAQGRAVFSAWAQSITISERLRTEPLSRDLVVKTCPLCLRKYTIDAWQFLKPLGIQRTGLPTVAIEERDCYCGNTLGITIHVPGGAT